MALINVRELRQLVEHKGERETVSHLREALKEKHLRPEDFSIRDLAEGFFDSEFIRACDPRHQDEGGSCVQIMEAEAVKTSAFRNITQTLVSQTLLESYDNPLFIGSRLVRTVPTRQNGELIRGLGQIGDKAGVVGEGDTYPAVGFGEDWVETPQTTKRGLKIAITKEAIFFDQTGQVIDRARQVGDFLGLNREKRLIDLALGTATVNGSTKIYKWKGTAYDTYQASTPWINLKSSNGISTSASYSIIDTALQLFAALTDPSTGEPIMVMPRQIVCNSAVLPEFRRIMFATGVVFDTNANAGTAKTLTSVPMAQLMPGISSYELLSNAMVDARYTAGSLASDDWFFGDFTRAFAYMENWPITLVQAPPNSQDEFERDIVTQFKASERGVGAVMDPRYVQHNYTS